MWDLAKFAECVKETYATTSKHHTMIRKVICNSAVKRVMQIVAMENFLEFENHP
jgi:hypothetical protein